MSEIREGNSSGSTMRGESGTESLDRKPSEIGDSGPRRGPWVPIVGGGVLLAVLALIQAPRSESRESLQEREPARRSTQAPRLEELPEPVPAEGTSAPVANAAEAPSALAQELMLSLQRQAIEQAGENRRRAAERQRSPIVIYDKAVPKAGASGGRSMGSGTRRGSAGSEAAFGFAPAPRSGERGELGREERFAESAALEPVETVRAERIAHPSTLVPQGTFIHGVLETELQSDLPGMIRAQVSTSVPAFDGTIVIPRGSRLIGRYQSGLVRGQTRVFVIWTRLLRPDGVSMRIDSPGTDVLGRAGVGGEVDTHFFEIFGSSILLSLIDGGLDVAAASVQDGGATVVQTGGAGLSRAAEIALQNRITVAPTIRVARGTPIQVVVSKDLDFAGADSGME